MSLADNQVLPLLFDDGGASAGAPAMVRHGAAVSGIQGRIAETPVSLFLLSSVDGVSASDLRLLAGQIRAASAKRHAIVLALGGNVMLRDDPDLSEAQAALFQDLSESAGSRCLLSIVAADTSGFLSTLPCLANAAFFVQGSGRLALSAADAVEAVCGVRQDPELLGGALAHARASGIACRACPHLLDAVLQARRYLLATSDNLPPSHAQIHAQESTALACLEKLLPPDDSDGAYDIRVLLDAVLDPGSFLEVQADMETSLITGFARLRGQACAIVASDPGILAGCLDVAALEKASRFLSLCARRGIPVVSLIDVPGFVPGEAQEHAGIAALAARLMRQWQRHGKIVTLVLRDALGAAGLAMGLSASLQRQACLAWNGARISAGGRLGMPVVDDGITRIAPALTAQSLARLLSRDASGKSTESSSEVPHVH